jgi:S-DNA-T family DNA segregation ATPase FtsK/SpoIIIE
MAARQTTARRRPARARRSAVRWPPAGLPKLEQRHLDLIGLGLVALSVFLAFLIYFDWDGGTAGDGAVEGLRWLLGAAHYMVPPALMAAGAVLVLRPVLPAIRPFRAGGLCLFASLSLALAAGTFGLGPFGERTRFWDPTSVKPRGGMGGRGSTGPRRRWWAASAPTSSRSSCSSRRCCC